MQFLRPSRAWYVCALLTALLFVTVAASSSKGREFTGYFDVSGVQEQGDMVQVTLHLQLFNQGDSDAKSVIVTLLESMPPTNLLGSFKPVNAPFTSGARSVSSVVRNRQSRVQIS